MIPSLLNIINPVDYGLNAEDIFSLNERTIIIKKWNWDYSQAHAFQRACLGVLQELPQLRVLICCNHPHVFTNGRGLQKPKKGEVLELVDFNPEMTRLLPYPLFQIERGGGLTFHHPGQFIFYPILKLNPKALSLSKLIDDIFDFAQDVLSNWGIKDLSHENKLLGLWYGERKIASMGIAIEKLTTFHGMALNLKADLNMKAALQALNPCGLSGNTYISADEIISLPDNTLESFCDEFLKRVSHGW